MVHTLKNIVTLTSTDWTKIDYSLTEDDNGFIFWADADIQFAEIPNPAVDEQIPVTANTKARFKKDRVFWVRGSVGTNIYLSPFDK